MSEPHNHVSAASAPVLAERLIQAAVDYEQGRCSSRELAEARAAVEAAIPTDAQGAALRAAAERVTMAWEHAHISNHPMIEALIDLRDALASQPSPAATVEPFDVMATIDPDHAESFDRHNGSSAGNGGAPRDWFGDLNERVGKGLNAPLEPSAGQAEAIPEGFVSVELLQIARATADRLREENAILRASNKSIFSAIDASEDRLRSVEDLRMGDVAMEFRRLRETLFAKSDLAKGPNTERQASSAGNGGEK